MKRFDLPRADYPFTIRAFRHDNREEVWTHTVTGPGAVFVPPLREELGTPVWIAVEMGHGEKVVTCWRCGMTSANPNDVRELHCGECHAWAGVPVADEEEGS